MKYIITLFWALILTQVTFYLGSALDGSTYNPTHAIIFAVVITGAIVLMSKLLPNVKTDTDDH